MQSCRDRVRSGRRGLVRCAAALAALWVGVGGARAADHGDAPMAGANRSTDIADVYAFLDPNDNSNLIIVFNTGGFIVPGEAANFGFFDPLLRYRLALETTGDAKPDLFVTYRFAARTGAANTSVMASIELPGGRSFSAPTTPSTTGATPSSTVVTRDPKTGVKFFAA